jgi:Mg2+-importing ATPase
MPNPVLTITTLGALGVALAIPFSPLAEWFGFQDLPRPMAITLAGIVVVYLVCAELFKPLAIARAVRHPA